MSGVPQGSVLGPMLFLLYIDQAANSVSNSKIVMYADDIALYQSIQDQSDYVQIQEDVNSLSHWIAENHLKLNFSKCCCMTFSRKKLPSEPNTPLTVNNDLPLTRVNNFKYLGAILSVDLTWAKHINSICNKTRKLVGMFYRNFYKYSNQDTSLKLYKSLIHPHLEYASAVWSPNLAKDIKAIEDVQKFGLRVCTKNWDTNYDSLLLTCNVESMADRRTFTRLCLLFKIVAEDVSYPNPPYEIVDRHYESRQSNTQQLTVQFARTNHFKSSFFPCTTALWNSLNFDTSEIGSIETFKLKLQTHMHIM